VTQRGNGRAQTFFSDDDHRLYLDLLGRHCRAAEVSVWSWVLMPNHVHLIVKPRDVDGIRRRRLGLERCLVRRWPGFERGFRQQLVAPGKPGHREIAIPKP
jgi:REP element-mobilizing transposase RayT